MKITMAHGSGGKSSAELMKTVFGKYFKNDILDKMEDAAVLEINGKIAFSTDSFVVTPTVFRGGNIGKLAVCGTVNDLLMMGAKPLYLTSAYILEEGLDSELLETCAASMAEIAAAAGVKIVAGDTKVVEGNGGLMINTTGIGVIPADRDISAANLKEGDAILVSGFLGDHHACILSHRMNLDNQIESDCAPLNDIVDALFENGIRVKAMRDITRGGLGTMLNELANTSHCGIEIAEKDIPVREEVRGFCGILGLDPLYMGNEGKMLAVVHGEDAEKALAVMKETCHGKDAVLLGHVTAGNGVVMKTHLGGKRVVDMLYGEGLPRIC